MNIRMTTRERSAWGLGLVLALGCAAPAARAQNLGDGQIPAGVQILLRGPVHEAFAAPLLNRFVPPPIVPDEPPAPVVEVPPLRMPVGDNVQWIPGYWAYDDAAGKYLWVTGLWRN